MPPVLALHTLGPLQVFVGEQPLAPALPLKARALLAYLALEGGPVSRSRLAGLCWSDHSEESALANLRQALTRLRRSLPDHISADRRSVDLTGEVWVDLRHLERQPPTLEMLDLVRGELCADLDLGGDTLFDEWLTARRSQARATVVGVVEHLVEEALARGDPDAGVRAARRLVELQPLVEAAHRTLMRCFAAAGHPAAALAQLETCRHVLATELRVEPEPETMQLWEQLRRSASVPASRRSSLPAPAGSLVGREAELSRLEELLEQPASRLVTVVGPGGVGKTRLAVELAHRYPQGEAAFVSLLATPPGRGDAARDLLVGSLAADLGVALSGERSPLTELMEAVASGPRLLVVDNFEHLVDAAWVLGELLEANPALRMLVTSRRRLGLGTEWVVELTGLSFPPAEPVADVERFESVQLLMQLLTRQGVEHPSGQVMADIARAVEGFPLALELAARWCRSLPPAKVASRLRGSLELLQGAGGGRHSSMRVVMDHSWDLLHPEEQRALAACSVFRGAFGLAEAEAVTGSDISRLAALVDHSLLRLSAEGRYHFHELVRQYAAERLAEDPAREEEVQRRHAAWVRTVVSADPAAGGEGVVDDLRASVQWALEHGSTDEALDQLEAAWEALRRRSWFQELAGMAERCLARSDLVPRQRARALVWLALAQANSGALEDARQTMDDALEVVGRRLPGSLPGVLGRVFWELARRPLVVLLGSKRPRRTRPEEALEVLAYIHLGELNFATDRPFPMLAIASTLLNRTERLDRVDLLAYSRATITVTSGPLGLRGTARAWADRCEAALAELEAPTLAALQAVMASTVFWLMEGEWERVSRARERVSAWGPACGEQRIVEMAVLLDAIAAYHQGDYPRADDLARGVVETAGRRGARATRAWAMLALAEAALRHGRRDQAAAWVTETEPLLTSVGRIDLLRHLVARGRLSEDPGEVWELLQHADKVRLPQLLVAVHALEGHAGVAELALDLVEQGVRVPEALALAHRWLPVVRRFAWSVPIARPRLHLIQGRLALAAGRQGAALRQLRKARAWAERLGMPHELEQARDGWATEGYCSDTGSCSTPRSTTDGFQLSWLRSASNCGNRPSSTGSATFPSSRASGAPRQKWMPCPNERWAEALGRVRSSRSGSGNTAGSRLAAPTTRITRSPGEISTPPSSTGVVATRLVRCTGES